MIKPGLCARYKADAMRGVHHEDDRYMIALYGDKAPLDCYVDTYTPKGEITGPGYKPGGFSLKGFEVVEDGEAAVLTFDDLHVERLTVRDVVGALIYNASKQNRAVGVVALSQPTSATNGAFDLFFPPATAAEGLFVID
jgi:hypothetical protein